ncbi:MAG: SurA N-terminal domain-containing protein [Paludibacteraceae bacterium]|nr:SurA N-terminal domain-containing protein [Paludibacteraceae bacterium]
MATLGKIRSWGWVLILIVGLAMLAFILGDLFTSTSSFANRNAQRVATIEGEEVHIQDFSASIEQYTEMIKSNYNLDNLTEEQALQVRTQVWEDLVTEKILLKQGKEIGIKVTDKELVDRTTGDNLHPMIARLFPNKEGIATFLNYISSGETPEDPEQAAQLERNKNFWLYQVNAVRKSLLQEKYINLIQSGIVVNKLEAQYAHDASKASVDAQFVSKPYYTVADSLVNVDAKQVKTLYEKRKAGYKQQPNRSIQYLSFAIEPSEEDFNKAAQTIEGLRDEFTTSEDIIALVNSNSDVPYTGRNYSETTVPEQYKEFAFAGKKGDYTEISFRDNTYSMARIIENGYTLPDTTTLQVIVLNERNKERVDSIKNAVKGGAQWADLVKAYNPTSEGEGEFGKFSEEQLSASLSQMHFPGARHIVDSAFNLPAKSVFAQQVGQGTYVFYIKEQTAPTPKVKLAVMAIEVNPSRVTINNLYNKAKQYVVENNNSEKFAAAAEEQGLTVRKATNLTENENRVNNLESARQIIKWAYQAKLGDVSDVFECGKEFVVAALDEIDENEYIPFNEKEFELRAELVKEAKAQKIIADLGQFGSLEEAGQKLGDTAHVAQNIKFSTYVFGNQLEPAVIGAVSTMEADQLSKPIAGNNGVYVVKATAVVVTNDEFDAKAAAETQSQQISQQKLNEIWTLIRQDADIEDNRSNFY